MNVRLDAPKGSIAQKLVRADAEQAIIARCVAGETRAWEELHVLYSGVIFAFLRRLGVPSADIDDAGQEVFLQLYRSLNTFRGNAALKTWIYRLCVTQAERARCRRRRVARLERHLTEHTTLGEGVVSLEPSHETAARAVTVALARLSERDRRVLVLHALEGRDGRAIADLTGATLTSVWRILHYARRDFIAALSVSPLGS